MGKGYNNEKKIKKLSLSGNILKSALLLQAESYMVLIFSTHYSSNKHTYKMLFLFPHLPYNEGKYAD